MGMPASAPRRPLTRREFISRTSALAAGAWAFPQLSGRDLREAWAQTHGMVMDPTGTTLEASIVTLGDGPYFRLGLGPGIPLVTREDLASAASGREDRREPITSILHYTDFQLVDAQSPARVEFLDSSSDSSLPFGSAFRPQEAVVCHVVEALVRRSRSIGNGPVTGRAPDIVVCTGDNIDNAQENEMRWFRTLMDGGTFSPNSGAADMFEGVQSFSEAEHYRVEHYHPDDLRGLAGQQDDYKRLYGFQDYPGMLDAAILDISAVGVPARWYSAYGNHDYLAQGNAQPNALIESIAVSGQKVTGGPAGSAGSRYFDALAANDETALAGLGVAPARPVTADLERHMMSPAEYIQAHLDSPAVPGPVGHGFTEDNLDPVTLYYTFEVVPGVTGITLDTCLQASPSGTIGVTQVAWMEEQLQAVHSKYRDTDGTEVTTSNPDQLVVLFSHHRPSGMIQAPYERKADGLIEEGLSGDQLLEILHRYPNVVLWINGHSHVNRCVPHVDPAGRTGGLWEITTAAQIDPPQQARIVELVDNRDGTLSIFTTVIDHDAPPATDPAALGLLGLASIGRELAYNDFQRNPSGAIGSPEDINTELLIGAPFPLSTDPTSAPTEAPTNPTTPRDGEGGGLPVTGGGMAGLAAAAIVGAAALRRRGTERPDLEQD